MAQSKVFNYNSVENFQPIQSTICRKSNLVIKRHLERDGNAVKIVEDGIADVDKEIQSELKNAGLQNILKLQELRYGTIDNAIARAADRGVYADVSEIPNDIAGQQEFIASAQAKIAKLKADLGLSDSDLVSLNIDKLTQLYQAKAAAAAKDSSQNEGGAE